MVTFASKSQYNGGQATRVGTAFGRFAAEGDADANILSYETMRAVKFYESAGIYGNATGDIANPSQEMVSIGGRRHKRMRLRGSARPRGSAPKSNIPSCEGEVIDLADGKVICWLRIAPSLRVRSAIEVSLFIGVELRAGVEFLWFADEKRVEPRKFENDDLAREFDRLESEWLAGQDQSDAR